MSQSDSGGEMTTIQVSDEVWAALDRRKGRGESFDDVIRGLIQASPAGVGALAGPVPSVETGDLEPLSGVVEEDCAHFDVITGETCEADAAYRQEWTYTDSDGGGVWHFCEEHGAPDGGGG